MKRWLSCRYVRAALAALGFLVLAGWFLPSFLSVERYRRLLRDDLESRLGRPVRFGSMSFHLLPTPGFTIYNVRIEEDPRFGIEPFAQIQEMDCTLRWKSFWLGRLSLAALDLENPSFNIVEVSGMGWNIAAFLGRQTNARAKAASGRSLPLGDLAGISVEDGRVNFKIGDVKKPLVVADLKAQIVSDRASRALRFHLIGTPARTDLMAPSPGPVEFSGAWNPTPSSTAPLTARIKIEDSLLYSWLPLVTGRNPEIYGLVDGGVGITGTMSRLNVQGHLQISELHRWESLPPTTSMPVHIDFQASVNRTKQQVSIDHCNVRFRTARLHLTGSLLRSGPSAVMDLALAVQNSRLEDLVRMASRLSGHSLPQDVEGQLDGLLNVRGPWSDEQCSGSFISRNMILKTAWGNFPVPRAEIYVDHNSVRLVPLRISLAPHLLVTATGYWGPQPAVSSRQTPRRREPRHRLPGALTQDPATGRVYSLIVATRAASLREVAGIARNHGISAATKLELTGQGSATFTLAGQGWPPSRPEVTGRIEVVHAQLAAPGLNKPLYFPAGQIQVMGDRIIADPIVLVMGGSKFTGSLEHQGPRLKAWHFNVECDQLAIDQAATWFQALNPRKPASLLERIPGLASLASRLQAGRNIFGSLHAKGTFRASVVRYHNLNLNQFQSDVQISNRVVKLSNAKFYVAGGKGSGALRIDLRSAPARAAAQVRMSRAQMAGLAPYLPAPFGGARGYLSGAGDFTLRGLLRPEMATSLSGHAQIILDHVSLGNFDPVQAVAHAMDWPRPASPFAGRDLRQAILNLRFRNGQAAVSSQPFRVKGGIFGLNGAMGPGAILNLTLHADLTPVMRLEHGSGREMADPKAAKADFKITGSYWSPKVQPLPLHSRSSR
jgi:uncharacterized protein involved in outer membrane biogenesis